MALQTRRPRHIKKLLSCTPLYLKIEWFHNFTNNQIHCSVYSIKQSHSRNRHFFNGERLQWIPGKIEFNIYIEMCWKKTYIVSSIYLFQRLSLRTHLDNGVHATYLKRSWSVNNLKATIWAFNTIKSRLG